jgi:hypothetical protein
MKRGVVLTVRRQPSSLNRRSGIQLRHPVRLLQAILMAPAAGSVGDCEGVVVTISRRERPIEKPRIAVTQRKQDLEGGIEGSTSSASNSASRMTMAMMVKILRLPTSHRRRILSLCSVTIVTIGKIPYSIASMIQTTMPSRNDSGPMIRTIV